MKKQQIILVAIILVVIVAIIALTVNIINNNKSKEVYAGIGNTANLNSENIESENEVIKANEILVQNEIDENIVEKNTIIDNNKTSNNDSSNTGITKYKLEVNCEQNVVNVYIKDENGEYTKCVKVMLCSVGSDTPTSGTYSLKKYDGWEWKGLFGDVYGQYATQITGNILFHSVPYTEKYNNASLEYWEYDKLGTSASMGCVRLTVQNAKWIYNNCAAGTKVKFYKDSNPGPLGKPSEKKISSEIAYRNWDPTDPSSENPWRNYKKDESSVKEENLNTENINNSGNSNNNTVVNNEKSNTENNNTVMNSEKTNNTDTSVNDEKVNMEVNSETKKDNTEVVNNE